MVPSQPQVVPLQAITGVESVIRLNPTPPYRPPSNPPDTLALDRLWWFGWQAATSQPPALPWGPAPAAGQPLPVPPAIPVGKLGLVINSAKARTEHQVCPPPGAMPPVHLL